MLRFLPIRVRGTLTSCQCAPYAEGFSIAGQRPLTSFQEKPFKKGNLPLLQKQVFPIFFLGRLFA